MAGRLRLEVIRLQGLDEILIVPQSWTCGLPQQSVVRLDLLSFRNDDVIRMHETALLEMHHKEVLASGSPNDTSHGQVTDADVAGRQTLALKCKAAIRVSTESDDDRRRPTALSGPSNATLHVTRRLSPSVEGTCAKRCGRAIDRYLPLDRSEFAAAEGVKA